MMHMVRGSTPHRWNGWVSRLAVHACICAWTLMANGTSMSWRGRRTSGSRRWRGPTLPWSISTRRISSARWATASSTGCRACCRYRFQRASLDSTSSPRAATACQIAPSRYYINLVSSHDDNNNKTTAAAAEQMRTTRASCPPPHSFNRNNCTN